MANRLPFSREQWYDDTNKSAYAGAQLFFYESNTNTLKDVYSDTTAATPLTNPVIADADGIFPEIYGIGVYKARLYSSDLTKLIFESDPIEGTAGDSFTPPLQEGRRSTNDIAGGILTLNNITVVPGVNSAKVRYNGSTLSFQSDYLIPASNQIQFLFDLQPNGSVDVETLSTVPVGVVDASQASYTPAGPDAVTRNVQDKLRESVSVLDFGAVGDGVADDSEAIRNAVNSGAAKVIFPRTSGYYRASEIEVPEGVILQGEIYRTNTAFSNISQIAGFGAVAFIAGGSYFFRFGVRCVIDSMFFYGDNRTVNGCETTNPNTGNLTILNSAFHRFDRGLGNSTYLRTTDVYNTHFINCNDGARNLIDARVVSCVFKSNQSTGTFLQSGANANQFIGCRWEFDESLGFVSSGASSNSIIGGLIDREGSTGVRLVNSDLVMVGTILRRNGRFNLGDPECAHILVSNSNLRYSGLQTFFGEDDGGGGDITPNYTITSEGTASSVVGSASDLTGNVTSVLLETTTLESKQLGNLGLANYNNVDTFQSLDDEEFYTKFTTMDLAPAGNELGSYQLPPITTFSRNQFTLELMLRSTAGATRTGVISLAQTREGGGASVAVSIIQEDVAGTFGTGGEDIQLAISNVATDGSSFDITYTNNDAATWKVFSTLIK